MRRAHTASASASSRPSTHRLGARCHRERLRAALELPRRTTCCISAARGRDALNPPTATAPRQGRRKKLNQSFSGQRLFPAHTFKISVRRRQTVVELMGPVVEAASCTRTGEPHREGLQGLERQPPICLLQWESMFPSPPSQKSTRSRAGRDREGQGCPRWAASWYRAPAWRKTCPFCSTLHGGSLECFQAKGKIIERQKQTRKFKPGTSKWCRWLGKKTGQGECLNPNKPQFPLELSHGNIFLGSLINRKRKPVLRTCSDQVSGKRSAPAPRTELSQPAPRARRSQTGVQHRPRTQRSRFRKHKLRENSSSRNTPSLSQPRQLWQEQAPFKGHSPPGAGRSQEGTFVSVILRHGCVNR